MKPIESIGLVINPQAGRGFAENARIAREAVHKFSCVKISTGPGEMGAAALQDYYADFHVCACDLTLGRIQTISLAKNLAARGIDLILVIGGDGTLSDVALGLSGSESAPPILGIGVGSTNVGPLVTCLWQEIDTIDPSRLETCKIPAIQVSDQYSSLGMGFNDCVLGFTVVGTLEGRICDVDVIAKMQGRNVPGRPRSIGVFGTRVERVFANHVEEISSGDWIASVVVGFAERAFLGKAITGGVCLAAYTSVPAGCLVASTPLVQVEISREEVLKLGTIDTKFISFDQTMEIRVHGVCDGTAINVDGTPVKILSSRDHLRFRVLQDAIQAVRLV